MRILQYYHSIMIRQLLRVLNSKTQSKLQHLHIIIEVQLGTYYYYVFNDSIHNIKTFYKLKM